MAYIKYKELTNYFNFYQKLEVKELPKYVTDYVTEKDHIVSAYATKRDHGIFTAEKIVLFDNSSFIASKEIYIIPYKSISTIAIKFKPFSANMIIYMDSGYPITLKFVRLNSDDKVELRLLYTEISEYILKK